MAKLSAYNQKEVVRLSREVETPESDLTVREKRIIAVMSNGRILDKRIVWFKPSSYETEPRRHDYGWKVVEGAKGRLAKIRTWVNGLEVKGWTVERKEAWGMLPMETVQA